MGFYIYDLKDVRQHINLSEYAWKIIEEDIRNFYLDEEGGTKSGFLNTILTNFYESSDASISIRIADKDEELTNLYNSEEFKKIDENTKDIFIEKQLEWYEKKLVSKNKSYQKGCGEKFRINNDNALHLSKYSQENHYYDSIGEYLKPLFEEYALKPNYVREMIFFKNIIDVINKGLTENKKLRISLKNKKRVSDNSKYSRSFLLSPYKIVQDAAKTFNYVVGYVEEIVDGETKIKKPASFRISHIDDIKVMNSQNSFISNSNKEKLDDELNRKGAAFMVGDVIEVKIKMTPKGVESFNRQIYMRPQYFTILKDETYLFYSTEVQIMNYFFKFGKNVEILEPKELRESFIRRYKESLDIYK